MSYAIKIEGVAGFEGQTAQVAGHYVKSFDPDAHDGRGDLVVTRYKNNALHFDDAGKALEFWRQQSKVHPIRETDGRPNRPLTAYTVSIETAD